MLEPPAQPRTEASKAVQIAARTILRRPICYSRAAEEVGDRGADYTQFAALA